MTSRVHLNEVAPRDGLQIEPRWLPTADKIALIDALSATGVAAVEATSFTSPKAIPNLADAHEVMAGIQRRAGVRYVALVPNQRGAEGALTGHADEINLVMSASDSHGLANLRMTPWQSLERFTPLVAMIRERAPAVRINASLSTAFGCPFDGAVPESRVLEIIDRLAALDVDGVTLCDTTGMANPRQVGALCEAVIARYPMLTPTLHVHNTRGMGLANVLAGWQAGIHHFDAALGGLGGCPFAPGASGNVCSEDLVHMFEEMGVDTGVDLDALIRVAETLPDLLGHDVPGQVVKAGRGGRRYPLPPGIG
ncbi:hydroxymethylglutaryl-CoA lyase [Salinicola aestuarinus]|uniref:hydroxymethylglutaryl-CoA lyase n=1 Tax=Salinicola aestuarinus TaxID=1949082 RepID=UPI000DA266BE|nr:hydroxymethylglutaryl-CoA lyase [Salinicola aestuarinus]